VLAVVVAVMGLLALKLYEQYGTSEYSPTVLSLTKVTESSITVQFRVQKSSRAAAVCTVNAEARDGSIVGTSDVAIPAGQTVTVTHTVPTKGRAFIAEVPSCRAAR
jgi:Domain of unknown function (DUF4307)